MDLLVVGECVVEKSGGSGAARGIGGTQLRLCLMREIYFGAQRAAVGGNGDGARGAKKRTGDVGVGRAVRKGAVEEGFDPGRESLVDGEKCTVAHLLG